MQSALSASALPEFSAVQTQSHRLAADRATRSSLTPELDRRQASFPLEITPGILGNHFAVQAFLQRTRHGPLVADFTAANLRPGYEPAERYLVREPRDRELVAHVQLEPQQMRLGTVDVPLTRMRDFAVLPEYERHGLGHRMLLHAERVAEESGSMLIVARGENYRMLSKHGWSSLGSDPVSIVSPQRLLGQLPPPRQPESPFYANELPVAKLEIARLTHLGSLQSLYEAFVQRVPGATIRTEEYWSWLIKKGAHHRIYMYSEADKPLAYAVVRSASVLELVDTTEDDRGAARLLERIGADAIEQGRHALRIYAPFADKVHTWADLGGGKIFVGEAEEAWMVKILSMRKLIRRVAAELYRRVKSCPGPLELGIRVGDEEFLIKRGVRSMRITRSSAADSIHLTCRAATQLLLGYRDVDSLAENGMLVGSSERALRQANQLFPPLGLWRTRWDDAPTVE